jgi:GTP diphosphokinase / guanosine-3',5'-bis(diphosphate) 3'-diphosphatase
MMRQYELVERVRAYDKKADENVLNRAYVFSMRAHGAQTRASGDPYFTHPLEVAGICTDLRLDLATVVTALLHDTIEDTDVTFEDIEKSFGHEIAALVDGVTKLSKLELVSERTRDAENFRKFVLAMSNDLRVLLVKLADRLHNMRTLSHIPKREKRVRIAQETLDIYAPLAGRVGMQDVRDELEDLSFAELNPDARASILKRQEFLAAQRGDRTERIADELKRTLSLAGIDAWVSGRLKQPFSIWRKMQEKSISFEQLADIMGFRVVVREAADCYRALGLLHTKWRTVPGRFKDYISLKKPNGYQSLHTTIVGPENARIEVQIRTFEMDAIAQRGVAAHWAYKERLGAAGEAQLPIDFLRKLADMARDGDAPEDVIENTKLELFQDQVFCFTPKGELISLPKGATPIDFAYAVHTDVGNQCVGARINGRDAPLRSVLANGDEVEIVRSRAQTPQPSWENLVVTGKARATIRRFIRNQQRAEQTKLGRSIAEKAFADAGEAFTDKAMDQALPRLKLHRAEELFVALALGTVTPLELVHAVFPEVLNDPSKRILPHGERKRVPIRGLTPGLAYTLAKCCHPIPGDRIVGITQAGQGIEVHTIDCERLDRFQDQPERWIDLGWDAAAVEGSASTARIRVDLKNEPGVLAEFCTIIAKANGNISNLKIAERGPVFFRMDVDIEVRDLKHTANITTALRASSSVGGVERVRGEEAA